MSKLDKYMAKKNVAYVKPTPSTYNQIMTPKKSPMKSLEKSSNLMTPKTQPHKQNYTQSFNYSNQKSYDSSINSILTVIELKKGNKQFKGEGKPLQEDIEGQESNKQFPREPMMVFPQQIFIGPFDIVTFSEELQKLEQLAVQCNKTRIIQWIKSKNQDKDHPKDFRNIQQINDQQFWCLQIQKIIELIIKEQRAISSCIRMLPQLNYTQSITLTRKQIFLLIASMFICIVPPQMNNILVSFAELMAMRPADEKYKQKPPVRLQKLKCVINYFKYMLKHEDIFDQSITFQRVYNISPFYKKGVEKPLCEVITECGKIQSGYSNGIIIDFANSNVGGGFLTNGSAQEEILFSVFPQMIVTKLLCASLRDQQAVVVHGARKINKYEGYSHEFKWKGTCKNQNQNPYVSCIVAVDAIDYSKGMMNKSMQYGQRFIKRQIHKLYLGISAALELLNDVKEVYTGRWGCGVFGADQYLKFCIQWIACSECGLTMRFFTDSQDSVKQIRLLVQNMKHLTTLDLLATIELYGKSGGYSEKGFLDYLKYNI